MEVLIIGGGIGGPALATFLARQGKNVTLVERSPEWKNIGYGVTLWGIGRKVLRELGIDTEVARVGYAVPSCRLTSEDGSFAIDVDFAQFAKYGGPMIIVPRAELHAAILEAMPPEVEVMLGTTVEDIYQDAEYARVTFSDGTKRNFDLVVGADGVHSKVRESLRSGDLAYSDWSAIAFWVPDGVVCSKEVIAVSEPGRTACFYPMQGRTFAAIYGYKQKEDAAEDFITPFIPYLRTQGWNESAIQEVLSESASIFMDVIPYVRMGAWSKGGVALLGDARHAFAPIIGMGANLALEDAYVLAQELEKCKDKAEIPLALAAYGKRRTPRINMVRRLSSFMEPWFNTGSRAFVPVRRIIAPYLPMWMLEWMIIGILRKKI